MSKIKSLLNESLRFTLWGRPETIHVTTSTGAISYIIGGFISGLFLALFYTIASILFSSLVACILVIIVGILFTRGYFFKGFEKTWTALLNKWTGGIAAIGLVILILLFFAKSQFLRIISDTDVSYVLFIMPAIARWSVLYPAFSYGSKKSEESKKEESSSLEVRTLFGFALSQKIILGITLLVAVISALTISLYGVAIMFAIFLITDTLMRTLKNSGLVSREEIHTFLIELNEMSVLALAYVFFTLF